MASFGGARVEATDRHSNAIRRQKNFDFILFFMRFRLFLILIGIIVLSLASGLGLRFALAAWQEPSAAPPDGNVPAPINVGSGAQIKTGDLTIGGNFVVNGGQVVGAPAGGNLGVGSINAQKICINGDCLTSWAGGQSFIQGGNAFGDLATLGTNDNFSLTFETNNLEKMRLNELGNLAIGTTNATALIEHRLFVAKDVAYPDDVTDSQLAVGGATVPGKEMVLGYDTNGNGYGFIAAGNRGVAWTNLALQPTAGNVGIGTTNPLYKLTVAGNAPRAYLWPSGGGNPELDFGNQAGDSHWAIYRDILTDELRFWRGENNLTVTSQGDVNSGRCFGPVYVGQTQASYTGNLNGAVNVGYDDANALCAGSVPGSHVCATGEILETIKCNRASLPVTDQAWISNGPPGYTARANDCTGWTSSSPAGDGATVYGAIWVFDASGGVGWVTTCNMALKFACCK